MAHHECSRLLYFSLCFFFLSNAERHECDRPCLENEPPKNCYYPFTIGITRSKDEAVNNSERRSFLSINGKRPGPPISVCQNDTVVVDVRNRLPAGLETALHWHGLAEGLSPFMDGVPMITQCPILPHTSFRYRFKGFKSGTYFYRAHSVAQQLDGVYGALVVRDRKVQVHPERTVIVSPRMKNLQVLESDFETDLNVSRLQVDVLEDFSAEEEEGRGNSMLRLRVINAAALDCPVALFTHTVPLRIVAVDGNDVKPFATNEVLINPGERIDLLVKGEVMKVTHIVGHSLCEGHSKYGFHSGVSESAHHLNGFLNPTQFLMKLDPEERTELPKSDLNVYLPFDASVYSGFKGIVDFRYKLGAVTPYAPSILSKNSVSIFQVYNKSFLYPPSPLLSQPHSVPEDIVCHLDEDSDRCLSDDNGFCECLQIINLPYHKNVDLFLINEGKNSNQSQTVHLHGHSFFVLAMESFQAPIDAQEVAEKEAVGGIKRNLVNPIRKDTIAVPNKGYVVLRLQTHNPGKWLIESPTSKARTGFGLEAVLSVENPAEDPETPEGFPTCGTMKEPDLVFGSD